VNAVIVEEAVKVQSKSLCSFTWLGKTVSINLKFKGIFFCFSWKKTHFHKLTGFILRLLSILLSQLSLSLFIIVSTRQRY